VSVRRHARWAAVVLLVAVAGSVCFVTLPGRSEAQSPPGFLEIHAAHRASFVPALRGRRPLFILVLGSDARPGERILFRNADSIHIIGVNLRTRRATILGFPRDSWVPIPGHGNNKINQATKIGGPSLLIRTIEHLTGIRISFWILTNFSGFTSMVNGVGGLSLYIPFSMSDSASGAFFSVGVHHLTGSQALAFSRDRHDFVNGDITRSENQGRLLEAAAAALHDQFRRDPVSVLRWVAVGWVRIFTDLDLPTLIDLGMTASQIPPSRVNNLIVPSGGGMVGPESVVFISSSASRLYRDMRADGVIG
jgi:LCP family protein required for cell wall assembly